MDTEIRGVKMSGSFHIQSRFSGLNVNALEISEGSSEAQKI